METRERSVFHISNNFMNVVAGSPLSPATSGNMLGGYVRETLLSSSSQAVELPDRGGYVFSLFVVVPWEAKIIIQNNSE